MVDRTIFRGDDYPVYRPVYRYELVTPEIDPLTELPIPFNLAGCKVRATFKAQPTDISADPTDSGAVFKADIVFNPDGTVASATNFALPSGLGASAGVLHLTLTRALTTDALTDLTLQSDLQVTDALDNDQTITVVGKLVTDDAYTNRRV